MKYNYIRIQGIPSCLYDDINNISKNHEIRRNDFLKPKIKNILDKFSEEIKSGSKIKKDKKEITLSGLSDKTINELQNIANYIGVDIQILIKMELFIISQSFPEKMKRKPLDY